MTPTADIRRTDAEGRLTLPDDFTGTDLLVERVGDGRLVIRKADAPVLHAVAEDCPEPQPVVLSAADWELFVKTLENPPPPTEALRKLMAEMKTYKPVG